MLTMLSTLRKPGRTQTGLHTVQKKCCVASNLGPDHQDFMDVSDLVRSAGRAVLDMVEREWEPLSPGELEQRLDQAVEDLLEAHLVARVQAQPAPPPPPAPPMHHLVHLQVQQAPEEEPTPLVLSAETMKPAPHDEEEEEVVGQDLGQDTEGEGDTVDSYAVKVKLNICHQWCH